MTILASLLLAAAAVHGAGPRPLDPAGMAALGVYQSRLPSDRDGDVYYALTVSSEGRPVRCEVTHPSGHRALDARTCPTIMRYARFAPARDEDDRPVASIYDGALRWAPAFAGAPGYLVDMTVEVGKLPDGARQPVVAVRQLIAADGTLEGCAVEEPSGIDRLDKLACKQAEGLARLGPAKDRNGQPVRTLRVSRILFVEKAKGS